ncbi:MAG TPA: response regulator [Desulfobacterales bacterium]|nr:response regulator [Desulfobacterales bacterium]
MGINLLIVEGDKELMSVLSSYFHGEGFRVFVAPSDSAARKILTKKRIDVVLLGVISLKRKALALLRWIKRKRPLAQVILINTKDELRLSIEAMNLGAFDDFLLPLDLTSLAASVKAAWKAKKQEGKAKASFFERYSRIMVAATYAEVGEDEFAVQIASGTRCSNYGSRRKGVPAHDRGHGQQGLSRDSKNIQEREETMEEIKVLLVDDEEDFVRTLAERIRMRDLNSDIALNGQEALRIVEDDIPDVMVLDLRMPGIDGMEVLRRLRKAYPEVKVIILTGHGSKKDEEEARRLGAFEYLQKPADVNKLIDTIKRAYKSKIEGTMVAGAFAEAGEFDTARDMLKERSGREDEDD